MEANASQTHIPYSSDHDSVNSTAERGGKAMTDGTE
jgi:hypothetical protein